MRGETTGGLGGAGSAPGVRRQRGYGGRCGIWGLEGREEGVGTREQRAKDGGVSRGKEPAWGTFGEKPLGEGRGRREGRETDMDTRG